MQPVKKAVFPVAGLGTRFLPATKANPKEMLPIVDKPLIQYAVEEAISAGITQLIFVTSTAKRAIEDHFDGNHELEQRLTERRKEQLLATVQKIRPAGINCVYVRQPEPKGLGNAVLCAREVVGDEPFAVLLADDLIDGYQGTCLQQMVEVYQKNAGGSVIAVENVPRERTEHYGIVSTQTMHDGVGLIDEIVEKPKPDVAPTTLAVAGRYILQPQIFSELKKGRLGAGGEVQLTDAIAALLPTVKTRALAFSGRRYDCGSKLGYMQAAVTYAARHNEIGDEFNDFLQSFAKQNAAILEDYQ